MKTRHIAYPLIFFPTFAFAHPGHGPHADLASGFLHPVTGFDHLAAMLAVGVLAAMLGGRAAWMVPASFVSAMILGAFVSMAGLSVTGVEVGIVASLVVLGSLVAFNRTPTTTATIALAGGFALFHGAAHGAELPAGAAGMPYVLGFVVTTSALLFFGYVAARLVQREKTISILRLAGFSVLALGVGLGTGAV